MNTKRLGRSTLLAGIAALAGLALPATSAATIVHPAGHLLWMDTQSVTIPLPGGYSTTCTMGNAEGAVPAAPGNYNASGPVTVNLTTPPTFTSCTDHYVGQPVTITTSGTWGLALDWGAPGNATLNVPANGIRIDITGFASNVTNSAGAFTGYWQNGYTGYSSRPKRSVLTLAGGPTMNWGGWIGSKPFLMANKLFNIYNNTNPASENIVVGLD